MPPPRAFLVLLWRPFRGTVRDVGETDAVPFDDAASLAACLAQALKPAPDIFDKEPAHEHDVPPDPPAADRRRDHRPDRRLRGRRRRR